MSRSLANSTPRRWLTLVAPLAALCVFVWPDTSRSRSASVATETAGNPTSRWTPIGDPGISVDERHQARQELLQLSDSALEVGAEEMPAYWRLMQWALRRSVDQWRELPLSQASYSQLVTQPEAQRARPVRLNLNICRVLPYEAPRNELGVEQFYEVWGWTEDSRGALYVVVTPEIPEGIEVGERVHEQGVVYGYFCKLQGYVAANADAAAPRQAAPLIIGRMDRYETPRVALAGPGELRRLGLGLLLAVSLVGTVILRSPWRRRTTPPTIITSAQAARRLEDWLSHEGTDSADDAESTPEYLTRQTACRATS